MKPEECLDLLNNPRAVAFLALEDSLYTAKKCINDFKACQKKAAVYQWSAQFHDFILNHMLPNY